jgi:hypothetical protein
MNHTIYRSKKKGKPNPTVQAPEVKKVNAKMESPGTRPPAPSKRTRASQVVSNLKCLLALFG